MGPPEDSSPSVGSGGWDLRFPVEECRAPLGIDYEFVPSNGKEMSIRQDFTAIARVGGSSAPKTGESHKHPPDDRIRSQGDQKVNRSATIAVCAACMLVVLLGGCSRKGPLSVRFTRQVDDEKLAQLPRLNGSTLLIVDAAFWSDREKARRIPIARREKTFIIGPGAAEMAEKMLLRMFDEVVEECCLNQVEDLPRFDFVIRLIHESFDNRMLVLPVFSRQKFRVDLGAEVSRPDGSLLGKLEARGEETFWLINLAEANPYKGDDRLLAKASKTLNAAVQESLFRLMDELDSFLASVDQAH